ncbi:uroporphyrinogen decarboxylase [Alicyclobacillus acidoterrestris]|uniref:uroporphyrinogen decarboxylase n=1 Tax=Alicyclobacillus suci TaxID=2816080 RepID=UPI0011918C95|nr:uroporphyrinogen decarboxylase [Alicyclobacillus suci]GEO27149.1 uroporphyrinogen decarboxylase [Alicyclobacillus acidoterrestris]
MFNDTFLRACRREKTATVPVWFMRQAGRYDADYRAIRERYSLVEICEHPEICVEVTKMPVEKLGVDAAILFSDIMIPVGAMGLPFEIREHVGPIIATPIRHVRDVERLEVFDAKEKLPHVLQTIEQLASELTVPLIGFVGGPFTLASYMIEGGPSRDYLKTKQMMVARPELWKKLMDKLADMAIRYAGEQVRAGAKALQVFDSWVGSLAPSDFVQYVKPTMQRIFAGLRPLGVPLIYFGVNTGELLGEFATTGANVIGVDWRVPLANARQRVGSAVALQGNFDPAMLFAPATEIKRRAIDILREGTKDPGFIFNLGHGVKPTTDIAALKYLVDVVHEFDVNHGV